MASGQAIRTGMEIRYRRDGVETTAKVVKVENCPRIGDKWGDRVDELAWAERKTAFLTLENGGYCYGTELV